MNEGMFELKCAGNFEFARDRIKNVVGLPLNPYDTILPLQRRQKGVSEGTFSAYFKLNKLDGTFTRKFDGHRLLRATHSIHICTILITAK